MEKIGFVLKPDYNVSKPREETKIELEGKRIKELALKLRDAKNGIERKAASDCTNMI